MGLGDKIHNAAEKLHGKGKEGPAMPSATTGSRLKVKAIKSQPTSNRPVKRSRTPSKNTDAGSACGVSEVGGGPQPARGSAERVTGRAVPISGRAAHPRWEEKVNDPPLPGDQAVSARTGSLTMSTAAESAVSITVASDTQIFSVPRRFASFGR